jgi:hypothetical protein
VHYSQEAIMRISPLHGDQWPVAALHSPLPPAEPAATTSGPPAVVQAAAAAADHRSGAEHRHGQNRQAVFDPPLIAQRAVLGLPVGTMIADYAKTHDLPFNTVAHAVDLAVRQDRSGSAAAEDVSAAYA